MGPPLDWLRGGAISIPILAARNTHRDNGAAELSVQGRQGLVETRWATETPTPPAQSICRDHEPSARPYSKGSAGGKGNGETAKGDRPGISQGPDERCRRIPFAGSRLFRSDVFCPERRRRAGRKIGRPAARREQMV